MATADDYCPTCHDLDPCGPLHERDAVLRDTFGIYRITLENRTKTELQGSRDACYCCAVLLQACTKLAQDWDKMTMWLEEHQNPRIALVGKDACSFEVYINALDSTPDSAWKHLHPLPEVPSSPASDETMDFIVRCMRKCTQEHTKCRINQEFMPKRLLKLTDTGGHIVHPTEPVPYIALSYCWGGDKNFKTLRNNLTQYMDAIDLSVLPQCFKDVAIIAPQLGIDHLWVDSLCIIQDDHADWEDQFPRMSWVYQNATVVVAAASIGNCHESFLDGTKRRRPESFAVGAAHPKQPGPVRVRPVPTIGLHEDYQSFYSARGPLDHRGWPLQERLLATRVVVFSETELQWSCQTLQECEGGHQNSPNHPFTPLVSVKTAEKAFALWHDQVMEFSKRSLSFQTDKLPAISAVASHVANVTGSLYIAGMWKDNLIRDMCWERHMFESLKWESTKDWRAPTFAWASVQGNVFYNDNSIAKKGFYASRVLDAQATKQGKPIYGQVIDAWVDIRGSLIEATLETHPTYDGSDLFAYNNPGAMFPHGHPETLFLARVGKWMIPFRGDTHLAPGPIRGTPQELLEDLGETAYRVREVDSVALQPVRAWIMIVGHWWEHTNKYPNGQRWVTSIILGRSERVPGAYERLGYKNQPWPPWEKLPDEDFQRIDPCVFGEGDTQDFRIV